MIPLMNKIDIAATALTIAADATDDTAKLKEMMRETATNLRAAYDLASDQWHDLRRAMEFLEKGKRRP
jgi:hypothetical protein